MTDDLFLCVGGPEDGKWWSVANPGRRQFAVYECPTYPVTGAALPHETTLPTPTNYALRSFHPADGKSLHVWAPEWQSDHETLSRLIEGYRPKESKK